MSVDYWKLIGDGKCAICRGRLGQIFRRVRIDHGVINVQAANQLMGLSQFFGGNTDLAAAFDPTREGDHVRFSGDQDTMARAGAEQTVMHTYCLCINCYASELPVQLCEPSTSVEELSTVKGGKR